jgi:hypothetical protein
VSISHSFLNYGSQVLLTRIRALGVTLGSPHQKSPKKKKKKKRKPNTHTQSPRIPIGHYLPQNKQFWDEIGKQLD